MAATWSENSDPTCFVVEDINVGKTLEYLKKANEE